MKLIWTRSNSLLSKIIRAITDDDCSHFCIVLYDGRPGEIMFHSNLLGTHPMFLKTFLESKEIVHSVTIPCSIENEDSIWDEIVSNYDGKSYDYLGAIYLGYRKFLYRCFKIPMPNKNVASSPDRFFCDEVSKVLKDLNIPIASDLDTPHDYYMKIKDWESK